MYEIAVNLISLTFLAFVLYTIYSVSRLYRDEKTLRQRQQTRQSRDNFRSCLSKSDLDLSGPTAKHIVSYVDSLINPVDDAITVEEKEVGQTNLTPKAYPSSPPILTQRVFVSGTDDMPTKFGIDSQPVGA